MRSELVPRRLLVVVLLVACAGEEPVGGGTTDGGESTAATDTHAHGESDSTTGDETSASSSGSGSSSGGSGSEGTSGSSGGSSGSSATGAAVDTWENWALPSFFVPYCNGCHPAAGQSARDFSDYDIVVENVEHIRCGVAPEAIAGCDPRHIPPGHLPMGDGPYPTEDERWRLVDWIDAGMPRD